MEAGLGIDGIEVEVELEESTEEEEEISNGIEEIVLSEDCGVREAIVAARRIRLRAWHRRNRRYAWAPPPPPPPPEPARVFLVILRVVSFLWSVEIAPWIHWYNELHCQNTPTRPATTRPFRRRRYVMVAAYTGNGSENSKTW